MTIIYGSFGVNVKYLNAHSWPDPAILLNACRYTRYNNKYNGGNRITLILEF